MVEHPAVGHRKWPRLADSSDTGGIVGEPELSLAKLIQPNADKYMVRLRNPEGDPVLHRDYE